MPRDLFGNVTRPSVSIGNRKWYTLPLSLISHSAIVLVIVALPVLAPAVMPSVFADSDMTLITTTMPPPPPPPRRLDTVTPVTPAPASAPPVTAPVGISDELPSVEAAQPDIPGLIPGGIDTDSAVLAPPPRMKDPAPPAPVRPGSGVRVPVKTHHVSPVYSDLARAARIEGIVILEATIGIDGRVTNLRVLRSIPLLDQSAIDAVQQWQFTPTQLNGQPVPVIMTVTVNFTLR